MILREDMAADLAAIVTDTDELGQAGTLDGTDVVVLMQSLYLGADLAGVEVSAAERIAWVSDAQYAAASAGRGSILVVDGDSYTVAAVEDDRTGLKRLRLAV